MNFLPATVSGDTVELPFGKVKIPREKADMAQGHELLIAGIRPEYFEDASVMDPATVAEGSTFRATVDVTEWLGSEQYAYIPFEAPPAVQAQLQQLERDLDGESLRTQLVVSIDSTSRVSDGEEIELYVNVAKMHLFDPESGDNLTVNADANGAANGSANPRHAAPASPTGTEASGTGGGSGTGASASGTGPTASGTGATAH
jgi:multiple sugar transport system ATP-binding protein